MSQSLKDDFISFYQTFTVDKVGELSSIYADGVVFVDPIHKVSGLPALKKYFLHLCSSEGSSYFAITDVIASDHNTLLVNGTSEQTAFFRWVMTYNHPSLSGGKSLNLVGGSMIRFGDRITHQEDFYDLGQMVYQHIPVLGWAVKKVKNHLAGDADPTPSANVTGRSSNLSEKTL